MKGIIIEDEKSLQNDLISLLNKFHPQIEIVAVCANVDTGKEALMLHQPDIVFADIDLKGRESFEIFKDLTEVNFSLIFTTAFNSFATEAFKLNAVDYLLKPIGVVELSEAIKKAKSKQTESGMKEKLKSFFETLTLSSNGREKQRLLITTNQGIEIIQIEEIIRCESDKNYTEFFLTDDRKLISSKTIKEYEQVLEQNGFKRIHKSHIVNLSFIRSYNKLTHSIKLANGDSIEVARRRRDELIQMLSA